MIQYLCDDKRHLICKPYSIDGLHAMAGVLRLKRHWFHRGRMPHYDIPKSRIPEISARCELVSSREIVRIIQSHKPALFQT